MAVKITLVIKTDLDLQVGGIFLQFHSNASNKDLLSMSDARGKNKMSWGERVNSINKYQCQGDEPTLKDGSVFHAVLSSQNFMIWSWNCSRFIKANVCSVSLLCCGSRESVWVCVGWNPNYTLFCFLTDATTIGEEGNVRAACGSCRGLFVFCLLSGHGRVSLQPGSVRFCLSCIRHVFIFVLAKNWSTTLTKSEQSVSAHDVLSG